MQKCNQIFGTNTNVDLQENDLYNSKPYISKPGVPEPKYQINPFKVHGIFGFQWHKCSVKAPVHDCLVF